jgi:aminoglycoside phosphotransferase (APT) family kinase protein
MTADLAYANQITEWLSAAYGASVAVSLIPADSGRVNDTRIATVHIGDTVERVVIKRPPIDGAVFHADPDNEIRYLQLLRAAGAPVPRVRFRDDGARLGRPGFAMDYLPGRAVADDMLVGYLAEGWFHDADPATQRDTWQRFHDALADVHRLPATAITTAAARDPHDPLLYWRMALSTVVDRDGAPIQHEVLRWLAARRPAEDATQVAVCMGDARLANALFDNDRVWLLDWELGCLGNPAADIAYSLKMDEFFTANAGFAAPGIPSPDETWKLWEERSGRRTDHRDYWAVHAGMVISITATRAMAAMMRTPEQPAPVPPEEFNPFAQQLHDLVARAER